MSGVGGVRRRLRSKTKPITPVQQPLPQPVELGDEAPDDSKRQAYLVTFPHPRQAFASTGERLVAPSSMSKEALVGKVLDSFKNPVYPFAFMNYGAIALARLGDWREWHEKDAEGERLCIAKESRSLTHPLTTPRSLSPCNRKGRKEVAASLPTS